MSKRQVPHDPVGDVGTDPRSVGEFVELLREVLDSLPTEQREVLIALANNLTLRDFAGFRSLPVKHVREIRTLALANLRAAATDPRVAQYRDLFLSRALLAAVREEFALRFAKDEVAYVGARPITREARYYGYDGLEASCSVCASTLVPTLTRGTDGRGRRRVFCSNACRQRAYRRRRAVQKFSDADLARLAPLSNLLRIL